MKRVEAMVLSMTPRERSMPHTIDGKRRQRIARGSGVSVQDVNQLLEGRKVMEKMMKQVGKGKMPSLPGMPKMPGGGMPGMPGMPPQQTVAPRSTAPGAAGRKHGKKKSGRR